MSFSEIQSTPEWLLSRNGGAYWPPDRGAASRACEFFWRSLPKCGLVPTLATLHGHLSWIGHSLPNAFALSVQEHHERAILSDCTTPDGHQPLTGTASNAGDYLGLVPLDFRDEFEAVIRGMLRWPFGNWYESSIGYADGASGSFAITAFPIAASDPDSPDCLFGCVEHDLVCNPFDRILRPIEIAYPSAFQFLDIGAGLPAQG